ncbi:MAG TPA: hypothetical protein ENH13_00070 [Euryarchaeota archaeon]|nr:hypothetical protein [Euryarchaeota archaeon]
MRFLNLSPIILASILLFCLSPVIIEVHADSSQGVERLGSLESNWQLTRGIDVDGSFVYVATAYTGLKILDCSDPTNPVIIGNYYYSDSESSGYDVDVVDGYAYYVDYYRHLRVIDVSNPSSPEEVSFLESVWTPSNIIVSNEYAYISGAGFFIVDISDPLAPEQVGYWEIGESRGHDLAISGDYAYLNTNIRQYIIDISDPEEPHMVYYFSTNENNPFIDVCAQGNYLYTARSSGLTIYDVSDPLNPVEYGSIPGNSISSMEVVGDRGYIKEDPEFRTVV